MAAVAALSVAASAEYTVRRGDTLSGIAARHGTTVSALVEANGITDADHIVAGRALRLAGSDAGAGDTVTHRVRPGEHLTGIARRYGVDVPTIVAANDLRDADLILVGRELSITRAASGAGAGGGASAASQGSAASAPSGALTREQVGRLIERVAAEHGWSPAFVKALAWQESGWRNDVVSSAGAVGIMQVLPGTGRFVSRELAGRELDLHDPEDNVTAGVLFLDYLYGLTGRDAERTLAGYYQGLASVSRHGMFDDTKRYIANVLALRGHFR